MTNVLAQNLQNILTEGAATAARSEAVSTQLPGRTNGPADIYRHLVLSAELARTGTPTRLLDLHEWNSEDPFGTALDNAINTTGIQIGNYVRAIVCSVESLIFFIPCRCCSCHIS
jgi:hypothetical protein